MLPGTSGLLGMGDKPDIENRARHDVVEAADDLAN
jgi:hypothetical protein